MRVKEFWRFPVKSMQGEACEDLRVEAHGVSGDRSFGVLDLATGTVISAKREARLLEATARMSGDEILVRLPGGNEMPAGDALDRGLTTWLGREARLVKAASHGLGTFECPEDYENDDSAVVTWQGTGRSFVDESDVHLLTTADLELLRSQRPALQWDIRRFRPNFVLDAGPGVVSMDLLHQNLQIGTAILRVNKACSRCVMTTRAQPGNVVRQLDILRHVIRDCENVVGVRASVVRPGNVFQGCEAVMVETEASPTAAIESPAKASR